MMDALDILKAGRAKITNPKDWGKGPRPERLRFESCCAAEAIEELDHSFDREYSRAILALRNAAGLDNNFGIPKWNDAPERTHAEVLAAFDLAIATLRL